MMDQRSVRLKLRFAQCLDAFPVQGRNICDKFFRRFRNFVNRFTLFSLFLSLRSRLTAARCCGLLFLLRSGL